MIGLIRWVKRVLVLKYDRGCERVRVVEFVRRLTPLSRRLVLVSILQLGLLGRGWAKCAVKFDFLRRKLLRIPLVRIPFRKQDLRHILRRRTPNSPRASV